jgi:hypothetical protein
MQLHGTSGGCWRCVRATTCAHGACACAHTYLHAATAACCARACLSAYPLHESQAARQPGNQAARQPARQSTSHCIVHLPLLLPSSPPATFTRTPLLFTLLSHLVLHPTLLTCTHSDLWTTGVSKCRRASGRTNTYLYCSLAVMAAELGKLAEARAWFQEGTRLAGGRSSCALWHAWAVTESRLGDGSAVRCVISQCQSVPVSTCQYLSVPVTASQPLCCRQSPTERLLAACTAMQCMQLTLYLLTPCYSLHHRTKK